MQANVTQVMKSCKATEDGAVTRDQAQQEDLSTPWQCRVGGRKEKREA